MQRKQITYAIHVMLPNGKWFIASRNLSVVEAHAYRVKYANDPTIKILTE